MLSRSSVVGHVRCCHCCVSTEENGNARNAAAAVYSRIATGERLNAGQSLTVRGAALQGSDWEGVRSFEHVKARFPALLYEVVCL